jgi:hypothetical protein
MKWTISLAAIAGLAMSASNCFADTDVLAKSGAWQAFGGTTNSGKKVCGMSSSGGGKYYSVKYFAGDDTLTIQLGNKEWTVKDKAKVKVEMKFDKESPWKATAIGMHFGDGDAGLEFDISNKQLETFMTEFSTADKLTVNFPGAEVSSWLGSMDGASVVFQKFAQCMKKM